jgi:uncharacterized Ntn-hydrolase superfamily protein
MTFSILGRCAASGMFGVAITTSSIAVASRCPWARAGVGAVSTQNVTDPRLGPAILDLLEEGLAAPEALERAMAGHAHRAHRQLSVVDAAGRCAHYSGAKTLGTHAAAEGRDCVAAGNLLSDTGVPAAMTARFEADPDAHLAERLLGGLEAGLAAGGEMGPVKSAGLLVAHDLPWPLVDLRVDWDDDDPVAALRALWRAYAPQMDDYVTRALDPDAAPTYGVPGDM